MPGFTLGEIILLIDPAFTRRIPLVVRETDKRIQEIEVIESKISLGELTDSELIDLENSLPKTDYIRTIDVGTLVVENFSSYLDYYSLTPKVIITIVGRSKLTDVRAMLNTRAKVSVISLNVALRFKIPITYSSGIALWTITRNKSRFIGFIDNVAVTIRNTIVRT
jgi:hypothetical protein